MALSNDDKVRAARNVAREWVRGDSDYQLAPDAPVELVHGGAWVTMRVFVNANEIELEE
jgi:hypothetical protein